MYKKGKKFGFVAFLYIFRENFDNTLEKFFALILQRQKLGISPTTVGTCWYLLIQQPTGRLMIIQYSLVLVYLHWQAQCGKVTAWWVLNCLFFFFSFSLSVCLSPLLCLYPIVWLLLLPSICCIIAITSSLSESVSY